MDFGIAGRVALVVGGSKGMGAEAAKMLAAEGCRVAVVARTPKHIDRVVAEIRDAGGEAVGIPSDMSTEDGINEAVATTTEALGAGMTGGAGSAAINPAARTSRAATSVAMGDLVDGVIRRGVEQR